MSGIPFILNTQSSLGRLLLLLLLIYTTSTAICQAPVSALHIIVLSDSTARVDQTNGVDYGPNDRVNLWPNRLAMELRDHLGGSGLLALEANARAYDTDLWKVSGHYSFTDRIGPYQDAIGQGGHIPAHGSTVMLMPGETALLSEQYGDTLWLYWASCPDSSPFTVIIDAIPQGQVGDERSAACTARRTRIFTGKPGKHTFSISALSGNSCIYAAEWTNGHGGLEVDNLAIGGATSTFYAGPQKLAYLPAIPNIGLVIIALGINDFLHDTPLSLYRSNLASIIESVHRSSATASILFLNQYPVVQDGHRNSLGLAQSVYWDAARQIATANKLPLIALSDSWGSLSSVVARGLLTPDFVHPSDEGGKQLAIELSRFITARGLLLPKRKQPE